MMSAFEGPATEFLSSQARNPVDEYLNNQALENSKYHRTAAILLGWEPEYCDTGVAPEVSARMQALPELTF